MVVGLLNCTNGNFIFYISRIMAKNLSGLSNVDSKKRFKFKKPSMKVSCSFISSKSNDFDEYVPSPKPQFSKSADNISIDSDISITSEEIYWNSSDEDKRYNLSFAGCGFLGIYHLGACKTLFKHGKSFLNQVDKFGGASAGSLVAAVLAVKGYDESAIDAGLEFCYDSYHRVRKRKMGLLTPNFSILETMEAFIRTILPPDAHEKASGRLFISLTEAKKKKNIVVSQYDTYEDLVLCILGSSYVPFITGTKPIIWNGKKYIDGGLSENLIDIPGGETIFVSPFSGNKHISPNDKSRLGWVIKLNGENIMVHPNNVQRGLHAFFPPKVEDLDEYFTSGSKNALHFLRKENLYEPFNM